MNGKHSSRDDGNDDLLDPFLDDDEVQHLKQLIEKRRWWKGLSSRDVAFHAVIGGDLPGLRAGQDCRQWQGGSDQWGMGSCRDPQGNASRSTDDGGPVPAGPAAGEHKSGGRAVGTSLGYPN